MGVVLDPPPRMRQSGHNFQVELGAGRTMRVHTPSSNDNLAERSLKRRIERLPCRACRRSAAGPKSVLGRASLSDTDLLRDWPYFRPSYAVRIPVGEVSE